MNPLSAQQPIGARDTSASTMHPAEICTLHLLNVALSCWVHLADWVPLRHGLSSTNLILLTIAGNGSFQTCSLLLVELGFGELDEASNRSSAYVLGRNIDLATPTLYANIGTASKTRSSLDPGSWCRAVDGGNTSPKPQTCTFALLFRMTPALRAKLAEYRRLDPVLGKSHRGSRNGVVQLVTVAIMS